MHVRYYSLSIKRFFESLDVPTRTKVLRIVEYLKEYGHEIGMPYSRYVGNGVFELRTRGTTEVRLLYLFYKGEAVILHALIKKSEALPQKDVALAMKRRTEILFI